MPRARFYGAVAVTLVIFYYAGTSEVAWLYLLAYWVAALIAASFLYKRWNRGILGEVFVRGSTPNPALPMEDLPESVLNARPARTAFEGDTISIDLKLVSPRGTRGPARMTGSVAGNEMTTAAGRISKEGWTEHRHIGPARRGPIISSGWAVDTGDLLGFFKETRARTQEHTELALVLPRFTSLTAQPRVRELEASAAALRAGTGTELFGVREYRPGDPLRRIHWRSSARHGELIVREYEPPGIQSLGIFCDPAPPSPEAADQIARLAASEAWDCLRNGGRAVLWSPGAEPSTFDESRSIWALLEWLARYPDPVEGLDLPPPRVSDAVAVLAREQPEIVDALEGVKRRGGSIRAWVVGDAQPDLDAPVQHAGLAWPL
ncbi:MAG: hypothetical protein PVS3B2_12010 [Candidatus Dormibacteraceae bacterium]